MKRKIPKLRCVPREIYFIQFGTRRPNSRASTRVITSFDCLDFKLHPAPHKKSYRDSITDVLVRPGPGSRVLHKKGLKEKRDGKINASVNWV